MPPKAIEIVRMTRHATIRTILAILALPLAMLIGIQIGKLIAG